MPAKQTLPIELYFWNTPNGFKISIMLEELGVPYSVRFVNIGKGEQFTPEFLAISPNHRIPAIVDPEGPGGKPLSVFESAAILFYLGRKFERFYPVHDERERVAVEEWVAWQVANVGPVFGHNGHFRRYAMDTAPYAVKRFGDETHRLYGVLNKRLEGRRFVCADYSIADIALFGWIRNWDSRGIDIAEFPNVKRWVETVSARPAVQRGIAIAPPTESTASEQESRKVLFNQRAR